MSINKLSPRQIADNVFHAISNKYEIQVQKGGRRYGILPPNTVKVTIHGQVHTFTKKQFNDFIFSMKLNVTIEKNKQTEMSKRYDFNPITNIEGDEVWKSAMSSNTVFIKIKSKTQTETSPTKQPFSTPSFNDPRSTALHQEIDGKATEVTKASDDNKVADQPQTTNPSVQGRTRPRRPAPNYGAVNKMDAKAIDEAFEKELNNMKKASDDNKVADQPQVTNPPAQGRTRPRRPAPNYGAVNKMDPKEINKAFEEELNNIETKEKTTAPQTHRGSEATQPTSSAPRKKTVTFGENVEKGFKRDESPNQIRK